MLEASSPAFRLLKIWGDEAVVYDVESGDTHFLKPLTLALYQTCRAHPGSTSEDAARRLAERLGVNLTPSFSRQVDEALVSLTRARLLQNT